MRPVKRSKKKRKKNSRRSLLKPGKYTRKAIERLHAYKMKKVPGYARSYLANLGFSENEIRAIEWSKLRDS